MDIQEMYDTFENQIGHKLPFYIRFMIPNYDKLKEWRSLKAKRNFLLKNHGYKVEDKKISYVPGDVTKLTDIESAELRRINHAMDRIQFNGHQLKDLMIKYGVKKLWSLYKWWMELKYEN